MSWAEMTNGVMGICRSTFATAVVYTHASDSSTDEFNGIFDEAFQEVQILDGAQVITTSPRLGILKSDLSSLPDAGDTVLINSVNYNVVDYRPDGEAGAALILSKI